ncbi:MAG: hypothetical protein DRP02_02415 [Candidatus Gerdarchaeota archaeon]|nr:MAG: hypothetical protein DRP02_02415 [Candidatus Gerdarchaeota archaeon]
MNTTFEASFVTTGTPTIKIYRVVGEKYTLVKSDTMKATPVTGKYAYEYKEINQLQDYSARMVLDGEIVDGVYNGIFSTILARTVERGGSGGGVYKMTKEELERIVSEMTHLLQKSLNGIEIELPDGIGEEEILNAVKRIETVGKESFRKIGLASEKQAQLIEKLSLQMDVEKGDFKSVVEKIDNIISSQETLSGELKTAILSEMLSITEGKEGKFKKFAELLGAFRTEQMKEAKNFAKLLGAFRNELKQ